MNNTTLPEVSRDERTVLRLTAEQLRQNAAPSASESSIAVLEPGGLGEPFRLVVGDAASVDEIVVGYEAAGSRFERSWVKARRAGASSYYRLVGDSSSAGYISA
ncbi:hypothetical protein G3T36_07540 [Diaminobutyricibacter tongyongensis]|uniref:Uncharacterized protein n=1 Tax=Leifsonia tongyongensis TaxID=1268043 RepID=A0A6L9XWH8_9MICO|nr:hypothetical protein [Diaminobutyricibacter tongyongensis]NEN05723.1 hypothetical protein [Diaminobutyricibacter tongyongensis]